MGSRFSSVTAGTRHSPTHNSPALPVVAIVAGAMAVLLVSLLLYGVGVMLGWEGALLWPTPGARAAPTTWLPLAWMVLTPLVAAAVGGAVAGRWHNHRTGAGQDAPHPAGGRWHGLLAWVLGTALMALVMAVAGPSVLRTAHAAAASDVARDVRATLGIATQTFATDVTRSVQDVGAGAQDVNDWALGMARNKGLTDTQRQEMKVRTEKAMAHAKAVAQSVKEVGAILARSVEQGSLTASDARYVAEQVTQRSDLTPQEAQRAVENTFAQMQRQTSNVRTEAQEMQQSARVHGTQIAGVADQALGMPWLWVALVVVLGALIGMATARKGPRAPASTVH